MAKQPVIKAPLREKAIRHYDRGDLLDMVKIRPGEQKIAETIDLPAAYGGAEEALNTSPARFVIFGIPEDIGPRANFGKPGADTAFGEFLQYFLNMQDNRFLRGTDLLLLGHADTGLLMKKSQKESKKNPAHLRSLVSEIDEMVYPVVRSVVAAGKIPILIGGGHNNSYPALKGSFLGKNRQPLGVVNIDPHADIRPLEGRHSGNGFSYAIADGYLDKYAVIGLHENYNSESTWQTLESDRELFYPVTFEDMIRKKIKTGTITSGVLKFMKKMPYGLEIDVDAIEAAASSARTPSGLSTGKIRKMMHDLSQQKNIIYLNISEGIASAETQTGKLIAYLVTEFLRAYDRT